MAAAEKHIGELLLSMPESGSQFVCAVYHRFDATLRGFLMKNLRNEADAEDFAQEVYLRFSRLKNHHSIRSERAFLFTTAVNLLRDRSRRLATQLDKASVPVDDVALECTAGGPCQQAEYAEQLRLTRQALESVSKNCRTAFHMSRIDGKSYAEIATNMSISISMVEKHISAALKAIRETLEN